MLLDLNLREDIQKYFPNFEYFNCTEPLERLDFNQVDNLVGNEQEAFIYFWLFRQLRENPDGFVGLDIGCGQNIHFACLGVDNYFGLNHPVYSGSYFPQITSQAEDIDKIFNPDTFSCIIASHILEHVNNPIITFRSWCKILKKGGLVILLMPDKNYETFSWDISHKTFWTPTDFENNCILPNRDLIRMEKFNDLDNKFSFNFVGRRI